MSENVTLISFYHVFLIWRRDRGYQVQAIFRFFFVYRRVQVVSRRVQVIP